MQGVEGHRDGAGSGGGIVIVQGVEGHRNSAGSGGA